MTGLGFALLTADSRIVRNVIEARAIEEAGAIVFIIPTGRVRGEEMAERFDANRSAIDERSQGPRPAAYAVYSRRISRVFP